MNSFALIIAPMLLSKRQKRCPKFFGFKNSINEKNCLKTVRVTIT